MSEKNNSCSITVKTVGGTSETGLLIELSVEGDHEHLVAMLAGGMEVHPDFQSIMVESVVLHLARTNSVKYFNVIKAMQG